MNWRERLFSLQGRLMLTYLGLIVIGFGGVALLAGQQLTQGAVDDFTSNLRGQAIIVSNALAEPLEHFAEGEISQARIAGTLQQYAEATNTRLTLLDVAGNPVFDTAGQLPTESLRSDPEVIQAANNIITHDLRPDERGVDTFFTAAPVLYENQALAYIRLSAPATIPQATVTPRRIALGIGFLVFSGLALLLSVWLSSTLTRPLSRLQAAALKIAQGNLAERVPDPKRDEIGAVGIAFNQMATQVQAMVEEQRAFASNVSHELRTPLTTIRLRTEWLQTERLDEATSQQYISEIDSEANRLSGLVDDLILLSRIDAARLTIGQEQVDPKRLANALLRDMQPLAEAREIELVLEDGPDLPPIQANMNHLRVVFRNLLENALKYTPEQGHIRWYLSQEDNFLKAVVQDDGQGISPEDLPHVNKRFYRTDKARSRRVEGVGLGLALVQSIVDVYQGRFRLDSPGVGQGTTATVWWPFEHTETDHI